MGIGYKLLRSDLSSLFDEHGRVQYGPDWVEVPGDGAYVALTLPGLLRGGMGEVLARVKYADPTGFGDDSHVVTARKVRVLRHAPIDVWALVRVAIWGARQVLPPEGHPLRELCLRAVEAAERCARERTPESVKAARSVDMVMIWGMACRSRRAMSATHAAGEALLAAMDATTHGAMTAAWATGSVVWASTGRKYLARRLLRHLLHEVLPTAAAV